MSPHPIKCLEVWKQTNRTVFLLSRELTVWKERKVWNFLKYKREQWLKVWNISNYKREQRLKKFENLKNFEKLRKSKNFENLKNFEKVR